MLKRSHVDERGFDKVGLDLATAVTLVLLLHIAGVVATQDLRLLWTGDIGAAKRCACSLLGLVAYLGAVCDPAYTSWKKCGTNFNPRRRYPQSASRPRQYGSANSAD